MTLWQYAAVQALLDCGMRRQGSLLLDIVLWALQVTLGPCMAYAVPGKTLSG